MTTPAEVVARRRAERQELIDRVRRFAAALDPSLGVRAVVVFGSVARGDFNDSSDIDVLVVADNLETKALNRFAALGAPPPTVQPVPWTSAEWVREIRRDNPIAIEAAEEGVWVVGSRRAIEDAPR